MDSSILSNHASENMVLKKESKDILKHLQKKMKDFNKMKKHVEKTKEFQEDANSEGSDGYKLVKKYKNYCYKRVKLPRVSVHGAMVGMPEEDLDDYESDQRNRTSALADLMDEDPVYPLRRMKCLNLDKIEAKEREAFEAQRKKEFAAEMWEKTRKIAKAVADVTHSKQAFEDQTHIDLTRPLM